MTIRRKTLAKKTKYHTLSELIRISAGAAEHERLLDIHDLNRLSKLANEIESGFSVKSHRMKFTD